MPLTTYTAGEVLTAASLNANLSFAASSPTGGLSAVVPSSVAVGSGTGTANAVGQVTFSGASSVSLNGVFTSTYRIYRMVTQFTISTTADVRLRLRAAGSDNSTASSYVTQTLVASNAAASAQDTTTTSVVFMDNSTTTLLNFGNLEFANPQIAEATSFLGTSINNTNGGFYTTFGATHNQTVSYDGFTFFAASGNMTGTVSVYGYAI